VKVGNHQKPVASIPSAENNKNNNNSNGEGGGQSNVSQKRHLFEHNRGASSSTTTTVTTPTRSPVKPPPPNSSKISSPQKSPNTENMQLQKAPPQRSRPPSSSIDHHQVCPPLSNQLNTISTTMEQPQSQLPHNNNKTNIRINGEKNVCFFIFLESILIQDTPSRIPSIPSTDTVCTSTASTTTKQSSSSSCMMSPTDHHTYNKSTPSISTEGDVDEFAGLPEAVVDVSDEDDEEVIIIQVYWEYYINFPQTFRNLAHPMIRLQNSVTASGNASRKSQEPGPKRTWPRCSSSCSKCPLWPRCPRT
jgi:hypothetical protein